MSSNISHYSSNTGASRPSKLSESNVGRVNNAGAPPSIAPSRGPPPSRSAYYGESSHVSRAPSMAPSRSGSTRSRAPSMSGSRAPTQIYAPSQAPSRSGSTSSRTPSRALGPPAAPSTGLGRSYSQSHVSGRSRAPSVAGTRLSDRTLRPADSASNVSSRRGSEMQIQPYQNSVAGSRRPSNALVPPSIAPSRRTSGRSEAGRSMASRRPSAMDRDFECMNSGLVPSRGEGGSVTVEVTVSHTISRTGPLGEGEWVPISHPRDFDDDFFRFPRY